MSLRVPPDVPAPVQNVEPRLLEWLRIMRNALAGTMRQVEAGVGGTPGPAGPAGPTGPTGPTGPAGATGASGGTFPDAVSDSKTYGRRNAAWNEALPITGGTLTGVLAVSPSGGVSPHLTLNTPTPADFLWLEFRNTSVPRWTMTCITSESGTGNNGSDLTFERYSDVGGYLDTPLKIARATGAVTLTGLTTFKGQDPTFGQMAIDDGNVAGLGANIVGAHNGLARWYICPNNGATETGTGNSGSDFAIIRCNDAGVGIDWPLTIVRATGIATFAASPLAPTPTAGDNSTKLATTAFVATSFAPLASPTFTGTVNAAAATFTGLVTPSATVGIKGTTTNNNANAGSVGEVISSNVTSGVTLTSTTAANVTSISVTAGDWDITGEVWIAGGTAGPTAIAAGINTTTGAMPSATALGTARSSEVAAFTASSTQVLALRPCRASLSGTTNYFLVAQATFASGTTTATGNIVARRVR